MQSTKVRKDLHVYSTMDRKNAKVCKDLHVYRTIDRKNPKVRKDLNILRAVPVLLRSSRTLKNGETHFSIDIKVLTDLKRFLPLPPELLLLTQTAFILFILLILDILLQTTEKNAPPSNCGRVFRAWRNI